MKSKYDWTKNETDKRVLRLNELHIVKTCSICGHYTKPVCIFKNMIVDGNVEQCDEAKDGY